MSIAFLFPGQGAQKTGMGRSFYEEEPLSREVFLNASKLLSLDMEELVFSENDKLNITEYTQAALVCTCIAMLKAVEKRGIKAEVCAGLSLGEYAALYYSGAMSEEDALRVVRERGKLMQEAVPRGEGAMAAVLGLSAEETQEAIKGIEGVWIANYNCPAQIVISGYAEAVEKASEELKKAGAKRVIALNVSGPFHSPLLKEAGEALYRYLSDFEISDLKLPYVANYHGDYVYSAKGIRELLRDQVSGAVRFEQSIRKMIAEGVDTFIEIGPGKTLSAFVKKIDQNVRILNIENTEDIERVAQALSV